MPPLKIVYSTHHNPSYIPPISLSPVQIIVGPNYKNIRRADGSISSLTTPVEFDAAKLVELLPEDQKPDLFVALVDSFLGCIPRNLKNLRCPKLLIIADTHHGLTPISKIIKYCETEPFDKFVITHDPHHRHWFTEMGILPIANHLNLNVHDFNLPITSERALSVIFVGQAGSNHVRRSRLLDGLHKANIGLMGHSALAPEAAKLYGTHVLSFNCSLNADFNMRNFEVLSAGGCLLTDRLSNASGFQNLFKDGDHVILYDDLDDLIEKAKYYLPRPDECFEIAVRGHHRYMEVMSEQKRSDNFLAFAMADHLTAIKMANETFDTDLRTNRKVCRPQILLSRVAIYETVQELHKIELIDHVCCHAGISEEICEDLGDLPQITVGRKVNKWHKNLLILNEGAIAKLFSGKSLPPVQYILVLAAQPFTKSDFEILQSHSYAYKPLANIPKALLFESKSAFGK